MTIFEQKLREILDDVADISANLASGNYYDYDHVELHQDSDYKASVKAIIQLIKEEIIGEDEDIRNFPDIFPKGLTQAGINLVNDTKDEMRAKLEEK